MPFMASLRSLCVAYAYLMRPLSVQVCRRSSAQGLGHLYAEDHALKLV